ncbi:MAG: cofactor-independent phosphoglycerate mutase [Planctomycetes bacterium]|nr:cofactor-independent phosphoglycerate mutase [Planctomycetota bacterium]
MTKYVIIVPDGAADFPLDVFDGQTVLEAADIPNIDSICIEGRQGIVKTIPKGMAAGSDVAQMSLLGYDPKKFYSGRAPIEAAAMGIEVTPDDWIFRCNLVTFSDKVMADHSAGHISTDEARKLIEELAATMADDPRIKFYPGVSYRHLCVISDINFKVTTVPPHDIIGGKISKNLPKGKNSDFLNDMMSQSQRFFANHDINRVRRDLGENPVSSIWLWGQGKKAMMERFSARFGVRGAAITAVDLVRGLAKLVHFDLIEVEGATGYLDTNYKGKGEAAIEAIKKYDFVFVHIEAPDEAGHSGDAEAKKKAMEQIDKHIVGPVHEALKEYDSYRILVLPDHPTPVETQAHSDEPVPFAMAGDGIKGILEKPFSEENGHESGFRIECGHEMMEYFLKV